ncbi:MAG: pyruvate, phosphate dikinase [Proteobacteria bacterium]|nr:MAG: pyruvate, phosphate dikinase [Pseudomonadota bacterium]
MSAKLVYMFDEADASMRKLLGGKGANLGEMTRLGLPVPPGFTITTDACRYYSKHGEMPAGLMDQVRAAMTKLEQKMGKRFGDSSNPLLLSVRSGAAVSMPGMMDTVLNLGLNRETLAGLVKSSSDERFALDANRRFIMMFADVVMGISKKRFDALFNEQKRALRIKLDTELPAAALKTIKNDFLALVLTETGEGFPGDVWRQLEMSIEAVFASWNNDRAIVYRKNEGIPDDMGTAVNVQAMVFGNLGDDCGTGVAFTRDPATGENGLYGEYLMNAQGEDVVAGVRTPQPISSLKTVMPAVYAEFVKVCDTLEAHYRDMQDLEFTIERGKLYMLQARTGKRTGPAAVRIAVEMVGEGLITRQEAIDRVSASHLDQLLHPRIDAKKLEASGVTPIGSGIAASPGAAVGRVYFDADTAANHGETEPVILVSDETTPDDVHGMLASKGVLTVHGGKTSHAAVVARGFGIPCVSGCEALDLDEEALTASLGGQLINEGDWITINGSTGEVYNTKLDLVVPEVSGNFEQLMSWCDAERSLSIRANADNPRDAAQAVAFGAEGIGLCRTEHMFFERDRLPIVQDMILTEDEQQRQAALQKLEVVQQTDFESIFRVMDGRPVTIRLLDPPLHEFLPSYDELVREVTELRLAANVLKGTALQGVLDDKVAMLKAVEAMREANPMMGLRGVRLSVMLPGLVAMQVRAIMRAAILVKGKGIAVNPEIMIPLVGHINELKTVQSQLEAVAKEILDAAHIELPYKFGTMIEIPRAALTAAEIAGTAEFFSFGTNDLTQMTFGYSRDDAEGRFLQTYVDRGVLESNPFETLDQAGVGRLMELAVSEGRAARAGLKCGICGEHGGDPKSIDFCHNLGLDYVSCSPYRVPIARLAAAQAALRANGAKAAKGAKTAKGAKAAKGAKTAKAAKAAKTDS